MSLLRSFTAESLTVLAAGIVFLATAANIVAPEASLLFVLGLMSATVFHVISTQVPTNSSSTENHTDDQSVVAEMDDNSTSFSGLSTSDDTESSSGYTSANTRAESRIDNDADRDESSSTKPVFGSKRGPRSNRRNNGPNMGRR